MNIGIVLNYFRYFLRFPFVDADSSYRFITSRRKYTSEDISSLQYIDWRDYGAVTQKAIGDVDTLFTSSMKLGLIPAEIDLNQLCAFYEYSFEQFLEHQKIDLLISGGVTGFERTGIATARRMGKQTLCVWEGMFRPFTTSADPVGMNAEASVAGTPFSRILKHPRSKEFELLWIKIIEQGQQNHTDKKKLTTILGERFRFRKQLKNRIDDRHDIERIRLQFHQLAKSRISYYSYRSKYTSIESIIEPYIFFPLQTHTDSNILLNAGPGSIDAFLDLVLSAFKLFHDISGVNLVIKEHPMDLFRKSYPRNNGNGVYWIDPATSISHIINQTHCFGTLVINSTAGLESLLLKKPVLCLGNALYCYPELVEIPDALDAMSLLGSLKKLIARTVDSTLVKQFCGFIYDTTQLDGNIDSVPGEDEVLRFCASLKNRLK